MGYSEENLNIIFIKFDFAALKNLEKGLPKDLVHIYFIDNKNFKTLN
jgi:hypothetical protein